jgi:mannosyltransferase OCH1-like enzyme
MSKPFLIKRKQTQQRKVFLEKFKLYIKRILLSKRILNKQEFYPMKKIYNVKIPLNIYQTWHTKDLPPVMKQITNFIKSNNPIFNYQLSDDNDCREFIKINFDKDVLNAYDLLVPGAYKADLWRYCILYKNGGIYLDIKYVPVNYFKFINLTESEHFVLDMDKNGIYNALMVCLPGNIILKKAIDQIIENVKNNYYGSSCLEPTGPLLLAKFFDGNQKKSLKLQHNASNNNKNRVIYFNNYLIFKQYNGYFYEYNKSAIVPHYSHLWEKRQLYNSSSNINYDLLPEGTWLHSSRNNKIINNTLYTELKDEKNKWIRNKIFIEMDKCYDNCNGKLHSNNTVIDNNNINTNKWVVLLTTAIKINSDISELDYRKNLYLEQINKWLKNTELFIFIVESTGSGHFFEELKNNNKNRIDIISLNLEPASSSSILEANSIKLAMTYILETEIGKKCSHILKVTGRYFLYDIQYRLDNITPDADVYIQIHTNHDIEWQNTEYYGIKKELLIPMVETVIQSSNLMEHSFYLFIFQNNLKIILFNPFPNNIPRGGDKIIINPL